MCRPAKLINDLYPLNCVTGVDQYLCIPRECHRIARNKCDARNTGLGQLFALRFGACSRWIDNDGRFYRFAELYGCEPDRANVGLRQVPSEIAELIIEKEFELGLTDRNVTRFLPPDCWNKMPNYVAGGQKAGVAEVFADYGLVCHKVNVDRKAKNAADEAHSQANIALNALDDEIMLARADGLSIRSRGR